MIFTPEERRGLLALAAMLLLGQAFALWEEHRQSRPDRELTAWLNSLPGLDSGHAAAAGGDRGASPSDRAPRDHDGPALGGPASVPGQTVVSERSGVSGQSGVSGRSSAAEQSDVSARATVPARVPPGILEGGKLFINQASEAEIEALPGIGPALAARIVASRQAAGPFRRPDDLLRVKGIGPAKLKLLRGQVAFEDSSAATPSPAP